MAAISAWRLPVHARSDRRHCGPHHTLTDPKTLTIGFPTMLRYRSSLTLSVTVREAGVVQILGNVIHGVAVTP